MNIAPEARRRSEAHVRSARWLLLLGLAPALGCSMPVRVVRIDDVRVPERGIRYVLKRPSYKAVLRLHPEDSRVAVLPPDECADGPAPFTVDEGLVESKFRAPSEVARSDSAASLEDKCFCVAQKVLVAVRQELNGAPIVYEARSHTGLAALAHAFANSDMSLTLLDDGSLSAVSASEEDQTLEVIQAFAGLAMQAAKTMAPAAVARPVRRPTLPCVRLRDPAFHDAVRNQIAFLRRDLELGGLERRLLGQSGATDPEAVKNALESLALVRTEREARVAAAKGLGYGLPADRVALTIDGTKVSNPTSPWFHVELGHSTRTP